MRKKLQSVRPLARFLRISCPRLSNTEIGGSGFSISWARALPLEVQAFSLAQPLRLDTSTTSTRPKLLPVHVAAAEAKPAQAVAAHDAAAATSGNHALQAASGTEVARCGTGHVSSRFYNCRCSLRCSWCSSQRDVWGRSRGSVCFVQHQLAAGGLIHPPHFFGNCKRMLDINNILHDMTRHDTT